MKPICKNLKKLQLKKHNPDYSNYKYEEFLSFTFILLFSCFLERKHIENARMKTRRRHRKHM